ncbi:hypothetical protein HLH89_21360 [Rhizobium laguerreae]|uniref:hypothetical protein n=1 Tax=Rhizobium laguerreae TaxID=1076926 RepID=UPI0014781D9D|nr:hypothetical protein [Rhizobium laguerreae]NNH83560.1 hypothetical protein [Rhizobium laguerreae]
MIYSNHEVTTDDIHQWAVVHETCDPAKDDDPFLQHVAGAIRRLYGEERFREMADAMPPIPSPADGVETNFPTDRLMKMFRAGLPNPDKEGNKPEHLKNFRSETAEIIAREALSAVFGFATPPALHATKGNRNQPALGFDGWSLATNSEEEVSLVLIQVKGTDDERRPPGEAAKLVKECALAASDVEKLNDYLCACVTRCDGTSLWPTLISMMLELETTQRIERTIVSPVIIRGRTSASIDDLRSLRAAGAATYRHAKVFGLSLSIGAELTDFSRLAMKKARNDG